MKIKDNHFQHKGTAPKLSFQSLHTCMYIMYWLLACRDLKTESAFFQSGQSQIQILLCKMVKNKKPHICESSDKKVFI